MIVFNIIIFFDFYMSFCNLLTVFIHRYMITNVQSGHYFNIDISVQQCYETTCKQSKLIVANADHIPYSSCENITRNDTRHPYYGIIYVKLNISPTTSIVYRYPLY